MKIRFRGTHSILYHGQISLVFTPKVWDQSTYPCPDSSFWPPMKRIVLEFDSTSQNLICCISYAALWPAKYEVRYMWVTFQHPQYLETLAVNGHIKNDIGLIELTHSVRMNEYVQPIVLTSQGTQKHGTNCFISGWGLTGMYRSIHRSHLSLQSVYQAWLWHFLHGTSTIYFPHVYISSGHYETVNHPNMYEMCEATPQVKLMTVISLRRVQHVLWRLETHWFVPATSWNSPHSFLSSSGIGFTLLKSSLANIKLLTKLLSLAGGCAYEKATVH